MTGERRDRPGCEPSDRNPRLQPPVKVTSLPATTSQIPLEVPGAQVTGSCRNRYEFSTGPGRKLSVFCHPNETSSRHGSSGARACRSPCLRSISLRIRPPHAAWITRDEFRGAEVDLTKRDLGAYLQDGPAVSVAGMSRCVLEEPAVWIDHDV
jgi:hypothetical protein